MKIRPCRADDGMLIKHLRLRSLADAPYAFGLHSFAEESVLPDSYWHRLVEQVGGEVPEWRDRCVSYVVVDGEEACGTVTGYLRPQVARRAYLSAAWIDPDYRGGGLGRRLVDRVVEWAAGHGADHLRLWVDDTNPAAVEFHRELRFAPTGETQPVSPGSSEVQSAFERAIAQDERRLNRERAWPRSDSFLRHSFALPALPHERSELSDVVVLITGCSTGVGAALALRLAASGHGVYATMRNLERAGSLKRDAETRSLKLHLLPLDVQNVGARRRAVTSSTSRPWECWSASR